MTPTTRTARGDGWVTDAEGWKTLPPSVLRPPVGLRTVVLVVVPPVRPTDAAGLSGKVRRLLADDRVDVVTCDVSRLQQPDLVVVEVLARMQLAARQAGGSIRLRDANVELQTLLGFVGLNDVVPLCPDHNDASAVSWRRPRPGPVAG
jgi:ABC-type transporter Mla MlaB component